MMKKRFIAKNRRKKKKLKFFFFLLLFIGGIFFSFRFLSKSSIKIDDKDFVTLLIENTNSITSVKKESLFQQALHLFLRKGNISPVFLLESNYQSLIREDKTEEQTVHTSTEENAPLIYLYNSHQTEEYLPSSIAEFSVNPTVMMADYILQDVFEKNALPTIVEEGSIKEILNQNQWNYAGSYQASRILMEQARLTYPSLLYFIDVHRDSLGREKTTVTIDSKSYAKTIFLIGLENPNYQANLDFTTLLNNKLNEKYPGLSKGIYKKGGAGVNGVYNQDFSPYTVVLEIGGPENTTSEVLNSALAFADCFMEVISTHEG